MAALGGDVTSFSVLPSRRSGTLRFGETGFRGQLDTGELALIFVAPKALDVLLLGGYTVVLETGALPASPWARLAFGVVAAAAWVDFVKDVHSTNPINDTVRFYDLIGAHDEGERLPYRLVHGTIAVAAGIEVARGLRQVFLRRARETGRPPAERPIVPVVGPGTVGVFVRF